MLLQLLEVELVLLVLVVHVVLVLELQLLCAQLEPLLLLLDSLALHSPGETLLVAAILAPVPLAHVNETAALRPAHVDNVLADGSLEETLAALAGEDSIVFARGPVAANGAQMLAVAQRMVGWVLAIEWWRRLRRRLLLLLLEDLTLLRSIATAVACNVDAAADPAILSLLTGRNGRAGHRLLDALGHAWRHHQARALLLADLLERRRANGAHGRRRRARRA